MIGEYSIVFISDENIHRIFNAYSVTENTLVVMVPILVFSVEIKEVELHNIHGLLQWGGKRININTTFVARMRNGKMQPKRNLEMIL